MSKLLLKTLPDHRFTEIQKSIKMVNKRLDLTNDEEGEKITCSIEEILKKIEKTQTLVKKRLLKGGQND